MKDNVQLSIFTLMIRKLVLFLFCIQVVQICCKRNDCEITCTDTVLGEYYLGDSIFDSIPQLSPESSLQYINSQGEIITFTNFEEDSYDFSIVHRTERQGCPGNVYGPNKKEPETKYCFEYYKTNRYQIYSRNDDQSLSFTCIKNYMGEILSYPSVFNAPEDSLRDIVIINVSITRNLSEKTRTSVITFGNPIYYHLGYSNFFHDTITLNNKLYSSVYESSISGSDELATMYYNTSKGLLSFKTNTGENWFLYE